MIYPTLQLKFFNLFITKKDNKFLDKLFSSEDDFVLKIASSMHFGFKLTQIILSKSTSKLRLISTTYILRNAVS